MSVFARNCYCCNPILPFTCCVVDFFFASFNVYVLFRFIFLLFGETTSSFVTHESTKKRETVHSKGSCVYIHNIFVLCSTNLLPLKTQYFMYIDVMMINVLWPFSNVLCIGLYFIFFFFNIYTHWEREHTRTFAVVMLCVCLFLARAHSSQFSCFSRRSARLYSIYVVRCMVFCCCVLFLFSIYSCLFSSVFVTKIFLTHTYTIFRPNTRCTVDVFSCFLFFSSVMLLIVLSSLSCQFMEKIIFVDFNFLVSPDNFFAQKHNKLFDFFTWEIFNQRKNCSLF